MKGFFKLVALLGFLAVLCRVSCGEDVLKVNKHFVALKQYLELHVKSEELEPNLRAARNILAAPKRIIDRDLRHGAKCFLHLMVKGSKSCNSKTLKYLNRLIRVHSLDIRPNYFEEFADNNEHLNSTASNQHPRKRVHLTLYGRVDRLIDPKLELILGNCQRYLNSALARRLNRLKLMPNKPNCFGYFHKAHPFGPPCGSDQLNGNYSLALIHSIEVNEPSQYHKLLGAGSPGPLGQYLHSYHERTFARPCNKYLEEMGPMIGQVRGLEVFCAKYGLPSVMDQLGGFQRQLANFKMCSFAIGQFNPTLADRLAGQLIRGHWKDV